MTSEDEKNDSPANEVGSELHLIREELRLLRESVREIRQLVGPIGIPMPDGTVLAHTIHGQKYFIDPSDTIIAPQILVYRQWEPDLSRLISGLCRPDTVFVDVGANFGYFTCLAASIIGTSGKGEVHAFEPAPRLAALLRRNIEINWSSAPVTVHEAAAADSTGQLTLHIPLGHGANATLTAVEGQEVEKVRVPAVRLDDALPSSLVVDIMKIDVEGHELTVLKGCSKIIARSPDIHLIMEWSQNQMRAAGMKIEEIRGMLSALGLKPYLVDLDQAAFDRPVDWDWLAGCEYANILFHRQ